MKDRRPPALDALESLIFTAGVVAVVVCGSWLATVLILVAFRG